MQTITPARPIARPRAQRPASPKATPKMKPAAAPRAIQAGIVSIWTLSGESKRLPESTGSKVHRRHRPAAQSDTT